MQKSSDLKDSKSEVPRCHSVVTEEERKGYEKSVVKGW